MTLSFNSKGSYVSKTERWIASLSNGSTVFEDKTPELPSAWSRLKDYISRNKLTITNLRLEAYGKQITLVPFRDENGLPQINGYWQSSKIGSILPIGVETLWRGIGYLKENIINITWIRQDGVISQEVRVFDSNQELGVIINEI